jgi:hypothetical protein
VCIAEITSIFCTQQLKFPFVSTRNLSFSVFSSLQVFLLLVKRLASLHYNHPELPQDNKDLKSCVSPAKSESTCQRKRENNTNQRSKANCEADYDEVDYQTTTNCNYKDRINETINNSSHTYKNMGSNVSTAGGGKGLSGRRTQSSSEPSPFFSRFLL